MARNPVSTPSPHRVQDDWLANLVEWGAGKLLVTGIILSLISTMVLVYVASHFGTSYESTPQGISDANSMVTYAQAALVIGLFMFGAGMSLMWWGDIALPTTLFVVAIFYFTANFWLDAIVGLHDRGPEHFALVNRALWAMKFGGLVLGLGAIILQVVDISVRMRNRTLFGSKDTLMKYGSGVKEDYDFKNVFMGKCWQLPFCRKFVREKCPIYHARRVCWKERVGCMCEEEVIQGAMSGTVIPKDVVAAAKFIPYNNTLTPAQKAERCRQCVIYNEHQRHKYKLATYVVPLSVAAFYAAFREPLLWWTLGLVGDFDRMMSRFTFTAQGVGAESGVESAVAATPGLLEEFVLIGIMLFIFAQIMRVVEFCIFKLKI